MPTKPGLGIDPAAAPRIHQGADGGVGIVLIHGLTASPTEVGPIAAYLEQHEPDVTTSCPLLPGHGTSPDHLRGTDPGEWTRAVAQEVDRLARNCRSIGVMGVSMGAVLAAEVALADSRVKSVGMLAPTFSLRWTGSLMLRIMRPVTPFAKKSRSSLRNHRIKGLYSYDRYPLDSLRHLRILGNRILARLGEITIPTLIAGGRRDHYVPWSKVVSLPGAVSAKDVEIIECPSSRHILPHEPDAPDLIRRIHAFLRRVHHVR